MIRLAISIGGDSDTIGCMAGAIAACRYPIPDVIAEKCDSYLTEDLRDIKDRFCDFIAQRNPCEKKQQGIIKVGVLYNKLMDTLKRIMASRNA